MVSKGLSDGLMSIGQLASQTGVSSRTIRYYEELGILPEPERSIGGARRYTSEYRFYVAGALVLKELGFNLEEIRLIGRLAQGRSMPQKRRDQATSIVEETAGRLEQKIKILNLLMSVLRDGARNDGLFAMNEGDVDKRQRAIRPSKPPAAS